MKISKFLRRKIIPVNFLPNLIITIIGLTLFNFIINNKTISGIWSLIIIGSAYMITGIGFFGLLRWMIINGFKAIVYLIRLILKGDLEVTIAKEKVSFKTNFDKK